MKKLKKITLFIVPIMLLFLVAGCGFKFTGETLKDGKVGVEYQDSIDYAFGTDKEIKYSLKEESNLPKGLRIEEGFIVGIPEEAVENFEFIIEANDGKTKKEALFTLTIKHGEIIFEDAIVDIIIDQKDSGTVNIAKGAVNIKYEIIEGGENLFEGITIREDGLIVGTYDRIRTSRPIKIKATANDVTEAIATIQIRAIYPYLTFQGEVLADARVGLNYAASVATIEETSVQATYKLDGESKLPEGLELNDNGTITGIPTNVGPGEPFKIVASAPNYSNSIAEFKIDVILNHTSTASSKIINFGKENETSILKPAYDGEIYVNQVGISGNAAALNNNVIKYSLASDSVLPDGLILYENGAIIGMTKARGSYTFSIIASADGCDDVIRTFSMTVQGSQIKYESQTLVLYRGEPANLDLATANTGDDTPIKYTMSDEHRNVLSEKWGLFFSEEGMLTGVPKLATKSMNFAVTAEAEGFTSTTVSFYINIKEPLTETNRFEAEYISLIGKHGTGYSGAPTEESMISYDTRAGNNYFVNYLHNDTVTLEFVIWAESATTDAKLSISLGSELGNITLTPNSFGVYTYDSDDINIGTKTKVNYTPFTVSGGNQEYNGFYKFNLGNISLVEGYNTIQVVIHSNTLKNGSTGGPGVDYIEIETTTKLMWHPAIYNLDL